MKKLLKKIGDILLHDMVENILWGLFAVFCFGILVWMVVTVATDTFSFDKTKPERDRAIARQNKVIACVERKYKVKHIIFNTFEERDGNRFSVGNYGECGENPDQ